MLIFSELCVGKIWKIQFFCLHLRQNYTTHDSRNPDLIILLQIDSLLYDHYTKWLHTSQAALRPGRDPPRNQNRAKSNHNMINYTLPIKPSELTSLVTKLVAKFVNTCFKNLFNESDIEDLTGEAICKMLASSGSFNPDKGTFYAWAWKVSHNVVLDAVANKKKRFGTISIKDSGWDSTLSDDGADDEANVDSLMDNFLGKLKSSRDRRILLHLADGLDAEEIARREGMTLRAVYMAVYHIRKRLKGERAS